MSKNSKEKSIKAKKLNNKEDEEKQDIKQDDEENKLKAKTENETKNKIEDDVENEIDNKAEDKTKKEKETKKQNNKKNKDNKDNENELKKEDTKENKLVKRIIWVIVIVAIIIELIYGGYLLYEKFKNKFHNIEIEIGSVTEIKMEDFLIDEKYKEDSVMYTDLSNIDLKKVGEYKVKLSHDEKEEEVTLKLVDTTPPEVEFQDLTKYIDYNLSADDFIVKKEDLSEMETGIINPPKLDKFGDYDITVGVKDIYGNMTTKVCKLYLRWIKESLSIERGQEIKKEDLLYNAEVDGDLLDENRLKEIANSDIGEYEIETSKDGLTVKTKIKVTDLTPPNLEVKNISIYDDEVSTLNGKDSFIVSTSDASGEVTTNLKTELNLSNIGTQDVVIEAIDKYLNKTEKTATLTIMKDTKGPVISGLSQITIQRGGTINLRSGVSARDDRDGGCDFQVDDSKVDTNTAGTYYATYTSKDKRGNTTTNKRKIVVNHNQEDTNNKFNEYYNQNLAGKSVLDIVQTIRNGIRYNSNWGGDDPIWYGLTNRVGNCYVHALLVKRALDKKGVSNILVHTTDNSHYWNLVNEGGRYRHYDSTPGSHIVGPATDEEKYTSAGMKGRNWDRNAYPKAE